MNYEIINLACFLSKLKTIPLDTKSHEPAFFWFCSCGDYQSCSCPRKIKNWLDFSLGDPSGEIHLGALFSKN